MTIPYARPYWDDDERRALVDVVASGWWTNGPAVRSFEVELAEFLGAQHCVAVANGTNALHALCALLKAQSGRSLLVTSSLNFAAAASAALLCGYELALTDVDDAALNMSPDSLGGILERATGAYEQIVIVPVHYAGSPAPLVEILALAEFHGAVVVEDACHAVGGSYASEGDCIGAHPQTLAAVFSFHPTKPIAAGEGGAITTADPILAQRLRDFRNHNMRQDGGAPHYGPRLYTVADAATNFRMSDFHASVASVQLRRLPTSLQRRRELAERYDGAFAEIATVHRVGLQARAYSGHHLYPVVFDLEALDLDIEGLYRHFGARGIGLQTHYKPLHMQPAFSRAPLVESVQYPVLARCSPGLVSLPLFYGLTDDEHSQVVAATKELQ